jgi:flagellar motor switch/type III secretory pathway protein FliN
MRPKSPNSQNALRRDRPMSQPDPVKRRLLGSEPWLALLLARIGGGATIVAGGQSLSLSLTALPQAVLRPLLMCRVLASIDGQAAEVMASPRLIEQLITTILPDARLSTLTSKTRALAIEAALADALDDLEARLGAEIIITDVIDGHLPGVEQPAPTAGLRLAINGAAPILVPLSLPDNILKRLLALQAGVGQKDSSLDPDVPLAVRIGRGSSTPAELANLAENDVIVLEETLLDDNRVCLVVDDQYAVLGELDGKTLKLDGALAPMAQSFLQRFSSSPDRARRVANSQDNDALLAVVVDLAYRMAPLSELLRIDPRDPVPLPQPIDGIVEVRVNRRRLATGRLVRVGNCVGVRILRTDPHVRS